MTDTPTTDQPVTKRTVNAAGVALTSREEGEKLTAYLDIGGKATIGKGHTGPEVHLGLIWTKEKSDAEFAKDQQIAVDAVLKHVTGIELGNNQLDALQDLVFNVGGAEFGASRCCKALNANDLSRAVDEMLEWDHAHVNGKVVEVADLKKRRLAEAHLFMTPDDGVSVPERSAVSTVAAPPPSIHNNVTVGVAVAGAAGIVQQAIGYAQPIHDGLLGLGIAPHYAAGVIGATFLGALSYVGVKHLQAKNA